MSQPNLNPIEYKLSFPDLAGHRIHVQMTVADPDPRGQRLFLPAWIPGSYLIRDFSRQIEQISARAAGQPVDIRKINDHEWQCAPCSGPLQLDYVLYAWDLSVRTARVDEQYAFFNGTSVFLGAVGHEQRPHIMLLTAPPAQPDWQVYTSMPCASSHPQAATRHDFGAYEAQDYDALIDHPVLLGQPLVSSFELYGGLHELVFTPPVPGLDLQRITRDVEKICRAQIELFEPEQPQVAFLDSADRYTFITLVTENGYGGLEHRSSTTLMIPRRNLPAKSQADASVSEAYQSFLGLVSHEYFHTWHVKRIKPEVFAPYDLLRPNHTDLLWVFEGFTSYYDDLLTWRSGTVDQRAYLNRLQKIIDYVHKGSGRFKQSIAASSFDAWTRFYKQDENAPNALVSYYAKGALVAMGLDFTIQARSQGRHSLDDVMRYLWQHYGKDFYRGRPKGIGEQQMPELIEAATGVDCSDYIARYVYGCDDLPLKQLFADQGIRIEWRARHQRPSLEVRIDERTDGLHLATVHEQGAAHLGGLSAGDLLVAVEGLRVHTQKQLDEVLDTCLPDQTVTVHAFRDGVLQTRAVRLFPAAQDQCLLSPIDPQTATDSTT